MIVYQMVATAACVGALIVNVRSFRRWSREVPEAREAVFRTTVTLALVLERLAPFLDCDECGGHIDARIGGSGVGVVVEDDHHAVRLYCAACSPARTSCDGD